MTEDIITTLSRVPDPVIARNLLRLQGPFRRCAAGREQLWGTLCLTAAFASPKQLRVSCVLIDATIGKHIWAERFDGAMEDVFDLQDRITSSIVATIYPKMLAAEIARAQAKPTDNLRAYDLYLRALAEIRENTESSTNRALELLDRAIAADPQFSSAYGFVACANWNRFVYSWGSIAEAKERGYERPGWPSS
jgi:adenylate cyclase